MSNTETQMTSDAPATQEPTVEKRKVGRPRADPEKLAVADPDYFKNYYHETRKIRIECQCGAMVTKNQISKHKKSMKCQFICLQKQNE